MGHAGTSPGTTMTAMPDGHGGENVGKEGGGDGCGPLVTLSRPSGRPGPGRDDPPRTPTSRRCVHGACSPRWLPARSSSSSQWHSSACWHPGGWPRPRRSTTRPGSRTSSPTQSPTGTQRGPVEPRCCRPGGDGPGRAPAPRGLGTGPREDLGPAGADRVLRRAGLIGQHYTLGEDDLAVLQHPQHPGRHLEPGRAGEPVRARPGQAPRGLPADLDAVGHAAAVRDLRAVRPGDRAHRASCGRGSPGSP